MLLLPTVSYSPFSNLLYKGILLIGSTKSGFNSKVATPDVSGTSSIRVKAKLAGRKCSNLSVASIYSCVVIQWYYHAVYKTCLSKMEVKVRSSLL